MDEKKRSKLQERWASQDDAMKAEAVKALLATPVGRKYLWWLLSIGHVGEQPFTAQALTTSFACGELNVGNQIYAHILQTDPDGYLNMVKEMQNEQRERDSELGDAQGGDEPSE